MTTTEEPQEAAPNGKLSREEVIETLLTRELAKMRKRGGLEPAIRPEPRCRICKTEDTRKFVNRLLAHGLGYTEIVRCLEPVNRTRRRNSQITLNSVRLHAKNHFNLQEPARALYRQILERRAEETEDYIQGVGHQVSLMAYLETMMVKGYQELVSEERNVTVDMGMNAGLKLDKLMKEDQGSRQAAEQLYKMNKIIQAVKEVVPEQYFAMILAKLDGLQLNAAPDYDPEQVEDAEIEEYDIADEADPRDELQE